MSKKRILVYGINYYPEPIGIPRYTTEMAESFAADGHQVSVITAAPLYPTWSKVPGYGYRSYSRGERNGVSIWRVPTYVPRGPGFGQRIIYEILFFFSSLPLILRHAIAGIDALLIIAPPLILCSALLLPLRKVRKVAMVKDLQVDIAETLGIIRSGSLLRFLYGVESFLLDRADVVTGVSSGMVQRLKSKGLRRARCELFPDWVDDGRLTETTPAVCSAMRERLGLPVDRFIVGYSGNLARKQGIELLVEMARRFQAKGRDDMHFLICGDGPAKPAIENLVRELALGNVTLAPLQPEEDLPALLSAIDLHVIVQRDEVSDLVMPGKIFNIMACSRSLIITAPVGSSIDRVLAISGAGVCIPRDEDLLERTIEELSLAPSRREGMARKGRTFVVEHMAKRKILDVVFGHIFPD